MPKISCVKDPEGKSSPVKTNVQAQEKDFENLVNKIRDGDYECTREHGKTNSFSSFI